MPWRHSKVKEFKLYLDQHDFSVIAPLFANTIVSVLVCTKHQMDGLPHKASSYARKLTKLSTATLKCSQLSYSNPSDSLEIKTKNKYLALGQISSPLLQQYHPSVRPSEVSTLFSVYTMSCHFGVLFIRFAHPL